jgi:5-methyltetrahydrofolate corrinoid/iron sulfur protein methyltransferase
MTPLEDFFSNLSEQFPGKNKVMLIIGERINASRSYIAGAISSKDAKLIQNEVKAQEQGGADYIDVNAGTFVGCEAEKLKWVIEVVQETTEKPLCIDSPDPTVIKSVMPLTRKIPMVNSITLEKDRIEVILPVVTDTKAKVIALCQSEDAIASTADEKIRMAAQLVEKTSKAGIPLGDLYIDPLVYPLSTNTQSAIETLKAIERIMKEFPGIHTTCGLTNVSHGLPSRKLLNRTFLVTAISRGLDSAILDPTDNLLYSALKAALAICGRDDFCAEYIKAFRKERLG